MNRNQIGGKIDEAKGRLKKAGGEITGDSRARGEGMVDKAVGKVRQAVGNAQEKLREPKRGVSVNVDVKKR